MYHVTVKIYVRDTKVRYEDAVMSVRPASVQ